MANNTGAQAKLAAIIGGYMTPPPQSTSPQQLTTRRLFGDATYADLTIECEGRTWAVHRAVICAQSSYFKKACDGGFKVEHRRLSEKRDTNFAQESADKRIALKEDSKDAVNAMVQFFYKADYEDAGGNASKLQFHTDVYLVADK